MRRAASSPALVGTPGVARTTALQRKYSRSSREVSLESSRCKRMCMSVSVHVDSVDLRNGTWSAGWLFRCFCNSSTFFSCSPRCNLENLAHLAIRKQVDKFHGASCKYLPFVDPVRRFRVVQVSIPATQLSRVPNYAVPSMRLPTTTSKLSIRTVLLAVARKMSIELIYSSSSCALHASSHRYCALHASSYHHTIVGVRVALKAGSAIARGRGAPALSNNNVPV